MNHIQTSIVGNTAIIRTFKTRDLTNRDIGEFHARDFWGDDVWKRMKTDLDELLAFRKTIKQKPDECQRFQLELNQVFIDYYNTVLFHSSSLSQSNKCDCYRCGKKRTESNTKGNLK